MYSRTDDNTISYEDISNVDIIKYNFYAGFQKYFSLYYTCIKVKYYSLTIIINININVYVYVIYAYTNRLC